MYQSGPSRNAESAAVVQSCEAAKRKRSNWNLVLVAVPHEVTFTEFVLGHTEPSPSPGPIRHLYNRVIEVPSRALFSVLSRFPRLASRVCFRPWGGAPEADLVFRALPIPFIGPLLTLRQGQLVGLIFAGNPYVPPELRKQGIGAQMVLATFYRRYVRFLAPSDFTIAGYRTRDQAHRLAVGRALDEGKTLTAEVIADHEKRLAASHERKARPCLP